jgi:hypothetical protein
MIKIFGKTKNFFFVEMDLWEIVQHECKRRSAIYDDDWVKGWVRIFVRRNHTAIASMCGNYFLYTENIISEKVLNKYFENWSYILTDSMKKTFLRCFHLWSTIENGIYIWSQSLPELLWCAGIKPEELSSRIIFFACFWFQHILNSEEVDEEYIDRLRNKCMTLFKNTFKKYTETYNEREMISFAFDCVKLKGETLPSKLCVCRECGAAKKGDCKVCGWNEFEEEFEFSF